MGLTLNLAHLPIFMLPPTDFSQWWSAVTMSVSLVPCPLSGHSAGRPQSLSIAQERGYLCWVCAQREASGQKALLANTSYELPGFPGRLPNTQNPSCLSLRTCLLGFMLVGDRHGE